MHALTPQVICQVFEDFGGKTTKLISGGGSVRYFRVIVRIIIKMVKSQKFGKYKVGVVLDPRSDRSVPLGKLERNPVLPAIST